MSIKVDKKKKKPLKWIICIALDILLMVFAIVSLANWSNQYEEAHEGDCCSMSETKEMKEKIRKCKEKAINEGRSSTEASFGCLPVVPAVCVRCEKPIDEKIQWFMGFFMILLGASVLGLIPLSIGYLRSKNKK